MRITTISNKVVDIMPDEITGVTIEEDLNKYGAHAAIATGATGVYISKEMYDRVNAENGNILAHHARQG